MLALARVVGSRFHVPPAMLARVLRQSDPIITCGLDRLRLEGFSACCGVYGRVDLLPQALDGALLAQGTTNVDFNEDFRAALAGLRDDTVCGLSVGRHQVELWRGEESVVERKVPLPIRWLKGLVEVQAHQARMNLRAEVGGAGARQFLRSLPRGASSEAAYIEFGRTGWRLSRTSAGGRVRVAGLQRLRILEDLARHALGLRLYAHDGGAAAFELRLPEAHFTLVLSPEVWRGFSGEGQVLESLVSTQDDSARVAALGWQSVVAEDAFGMERVRVRAALAQLATCGRVGYDLAQKGYFQRILPFDFDLIERLHPRLKEARGLCEAGLIRPDGGEFWVQGSGVEYRVRLEPQASCTCPWLARHQNQRGPCKHILAARMMEDQ